MYALGNRTRPQPNAISRLISFPRNRGGSAHWAAALVLVCFGCEANSATPSSTSGQVRVSLAASTSDVMEKLAREYSVSPSLEILLNPGPTSSLANQIIEGAPVDLFLSANREFADRITEAGLAETSHDLLTNRLVLIAPRNNPAKIKGPRDLLENRVKTLALAGENVPAGKYAEQALSRLELFAPLMKSGKIVRAQDVRSALNFVATQEADAGIVYSTDAADDSVVILHEFGPELHDQIVYVLVLTRRGAKNPAARAFFDYLQSPSAMQGFAQAGFQPSRGNSPASERSP
jgi:molybdate transport system substrate-binding protein